MVRRMGWVLKRMLAALSIAMLPGCATPWQDSGVFYKAVQTDLRVESTPPGRIFMNRIDKGATPATLPLVYEQEVKKKTRKVSYWISQPGWAFLLTIASLGIYLPFSPIPVDIESMTEPTQVFRGNRFELRTTVDAYQDWTEEIDARGEKELLRRIDFTKQ
jgi:hypothetical protein